MPVDKRIRCGFTAVMGIGKRTIRAEHQKTVGRPRDNGSGQCVIFRIGVVGREITIKRVTFDDRKNIVNSHRWVIVSKNRGCQKDIIVADGGCPAVDRDINQYAVIVMSGITGIGAV